MGVKVLDSEKQSLSYEDFEIGDEFITPTVTVTETHVVIFAGLTGDYNMGHTSEAFCKTLTGDIGGGTRMAHGLLGLSLGMGLFLRMGVLLYLKQGAYVGVDRWRCLAPIMIGDTIGARFKVLSKEIMKKRPEWGEVIFGMTISNQRGETVQAAEHLVAMAR